jgi:nucleoside-diphosphate-sugar epimerase
VSRIEESETLLMRESSHDFRVTHIRYPYFYGPRQLAPREWSVTRRIRDGRTVVPVEIKHAYNHPKGGA